MLFLNTVFLISLPEWTGDGYLAKSCKILSESYKRMDHLTRISEKISKDKQSSNKMLIRSELVLYDSYKIKHNLPRVLQVCHS